jgi:hypothetical protein
MPTAPSLPFWDSQMVGPDAYKVAASVRTPTDPGRPIVAGEAVLLSPSSPMSVQLPDPRLTPGETIAITTDLQIGDITFLAYPGTKVRGGSTWFFDNTLGHVGVIFLSIGSEWRVIARYTGA